jgi:hypothetical protein
MVSKQGWAVALAIAAVALAIAATGQAASISGYWSGDVTNQSTKESYGTEVQVKNKLVKGDKGGETFYPPYECGGDLIFRKRTDSGSFIFKELLTFGEANCVDLGKVKLTPKGQSLLYRWTKPESATQTGKLTRSDD